MKRLALFALGLVFLLPLVAAQGFDPKDLLPQSDGGILLILDLGIIITLAAVLAFVAAGLRQPLIPAYILAGVLVGPVGIQFVFGSPMISDLEFVRALSELGITFLLFTVGIELELSRLKDVGKAAILIGSGQMALTFFLGLGVAAILGFDSMASIYLGLILAFSSTMVVIKILADRDELETLHGRIMLGILLMQDVVAVIVLSVLTPTTASFELYPIVVSILKVVGLFSIAIVMSRFVSPRILHYVSRSSELMMLAAMFFALVFALSSYVLGFSMAIGGFLGGMSLAVFPYNLEVSNRIKPLRDFFAVMFFVSLGMQFYPIADLGAVLLPTIIFAVLVMLVKPLVITFLCLLIGYERRTAFLAGIGLGQISEFSLILGMGFLATHPGSIVFPIDLILGIVTISVTPYFIRYGNNLYIPFSRFLRRLEICSIVKNKPCLEHVPEIEMRNHVVVFGAHIMGMEVIETLQRLKKKFIVVDHNPEIIKKLIKRGIPAVYGDLENSEVIEKVKLDKAKLVISTVPDEDDSMLVIKKTKELNDKAIVFVTARTIDHAIRFYREGADFIIHLKLLGGREASNTLEMALKEGSKGTLARKLSEIEFLERKRRDEIIDRIDKDLLKQIDELKIQGEIQKSETLGEE